MNQYEIDSMRESTNEVMTMTCVISRFVSSSADSYGRPTGTWQTLYEGKCWYWEIQRFKSFGSTDITGPDVNVALEGPRLQLPANVDVTEKDKVVSIVDQSGFVRSDVDLDIREVLHRLNDTILLVEAFK